jgi:hypothetical protein
LQSSGHGRIFWRFFRSRGHVDPLMPTRFHQQPASSIGMNVGGERRKHRATPASPPTNISVDNGKPAAGLVELEDGEALHVWIMPKGA